MAVLEDLTTLEDLAEQPAIALTKKERRPLLLAPTSRLDMNLLAVPHYTLNASASRLKRISYGWETQGRRLHFLCERPDDVPFPQIQHAELFYTLLAMFGQRPNDEGVANFRIIDIARNAGRTPTAATYVTTQEMLWRYSRCTVHWHESWILARGEKPHTWHGPLIIAENVFTIGENGRPVLKRNPRGDKRESQWHSIRLHPMLVASMKNQYVRVFLTETLQSDMSDTAKCVYRHFFRFSDTEAVYRSYEHLMQAFPWRSGQKRFIAWLTAQLDELKSCGAVERHQALADGILVKCMPIKDLQLANARKRARSGATAKELRTVMGIEQASDDEVIRRFLTLKDQGRLIDNIVETVSAMLVAGYQAQAAKSLRSYFEVNQL
jgi:hypothetical protein